MLNQYKNDFDKTQLCDNQEIMDGKIFVESL